MLIQAPASSIWKPCFCGDRERLAQVLDARVGVAAVAERRAERVQRDRLGLRGGPRRGRPRAPRGRTRLGLDEARLEHAPLRELGQQRRALGALLVARQQAQPVAQHVDRRVLLVLAPERLAEPLEQERARPGRRRRSTSASARRRRASWRAGSPAWSAVVRRRGGAARPRRCPASRSGSSTRSQSPSARSKSACASPNAFTRSAASAARTAAASACGWSPAAAQWCAACAVTCAPCSPASMRSLERARERRVHLGALARQQVVVHHLAQERVAEAVALVARP